MTTRTCGSMPRLTKSDCWQLYYKIESTEGRKTDSGSDRQVSRQTARQTNVQAERERGRESGREGERYT